MKVICAWCRDLIRDGDAPTSHGICEACRAIHFPQPNRAGERVNAPPALTPTVEGGR